MFVFEFADVLRWLSNEYKESRFSNFAEVISTSMRQLLPYEGHMCGIAKVGYYPRVVQHTSWDYGKNAKDIIMTFSHPDGLLLLYGNYLLLACRDFYGKVI